MIVAGVECCAKTSPDLTGQGLKVLLILQVAWCMVETRAGKQHRVLVLRVVLTEEQTPQVSARWVRMEVRMAGRCGTVRRMAAVGSADRLLAFRAMPCY